MPVCQYAKNNSAVPLNQEDQRSPQKIRRFLLTQVIRPFTQIQKIRQEQYYLSQRQYQNLSPSLLKNLKEGLQIPAKTGLILQQGRYPQKQDLKPRHPQR